MPPETDGPGRIHGTLVEVVGIGLLLVGKSGIGKSECALDLVMRGHRLVADDVVLVELDEEGRPVGRSPELVRHYLELRGIGIVHIPSLFGDSSVAETGRIELVIRLEAWDRIEIERLGLDRETYPVAGIEVASIRLPIAPGRNVASLVEVATRSFRLQRAGQSAVAELDYRVLATLRRGSE
jgi:HPr kinase/phosphorylase